MEKPVAPPRPEWQPHSKEARHQLDIAEVSLFHYISKPPRSSLEEDIVQSSEEDVERGAEEDFQKALATEVSGRVYADLGELHLRSSDYDGAVGYFMHALQIAPQAVSVQVGLERSWHGQRLAKSILPFLPAGQKIQCLLPFPVPGRTLWAVLSGEKEPQGDPKGDKAQCLVFEERQGRRLHQIWKSPVVLSFGAYLWVWPMTGHRIPELVFASHFLSGSWNPSALRVYRWSRGSFEKISETESACSHWVTRMPRTGRYQVRTLDLIGGIEMGHGGLVPWPRIYEWNGRRYVAANTKHPDEFHRVRRDILAHLKRYPEDPALWKHLGYTYLYDHQRRSAFAAFDKAERAYRVQLGDKDVSVYAKEELRELAADRAGAGE